MKTVIVDAIRFTMTSKVVTLPQELWVGEAKNYITFGKVCDISTKGAVLTESKNEAGFYIHALPIPFTGHSLTNMMYGKDGRIYLCQDGHCYTAKKKAKPVQPPETELSSNT